jgi:hypothetical protein
MRVERSFSVAVLCCALTVAGCTGSHRDGAAAASPAPPAVAAHSPGPRDGDAAAALERYYQLISSRRWTFAYAMLTPRYRASVDERTFRSAYESLIDPDVRVTKMQDGTLRTTIDGIERNGRRHSVEETMTVVWDGTQWQIDEIRRREVSPRRTP